MDTTPKYELVIWWSNEDAAFLVEVPELPGCMAEEPRMKKHSRMSGL